MWTEAWRTLARELICSTLIVGRPSTSLAASVAWLVGGLGGRGSYMPHARERTRRWPAVPRVNRLGSWSVSRRAAGGTVAHAHAHSSLTYTHGLRSPTPIVTDATPRD